MDRKITYHQPNGFTLANPQMTPARETTNKPSAIAKAPIPENSQIDTNRSQFRQEKQRKGEETLRFHKSNTKKNQKKFSAICERNLCSASMTSAPNQQLLWPQPGRAGSIRTPDPTRPVDPSGRGRVGSIRTPVLPGPARPMDPSGSALPLSSSFVFVPCYLSQFCVEIRFLGNLDPLLASFAARCFVMLYFFVFGSLSGCLVLTNSNCRVILFFVLCEFRVIHHV